MFGPVNCRENWKFGKDVVKTLVISDNQVFHVLIIKVFDEVNKREVSECDE